MRKSDRPRLYRLTWTMNQEPQCYHQGVAKFGGWKTLGSSILRRLHLAFVFPSVGENDDTRVVQESRSRLNKRAISRVSGAAERGSSGLARPESKGKTKKRADAGALNISRRINSGNLRHKFWSAWDILSGEREYSGSARRRRRCSRAFLARASKMASAR